MLSSKKQCSNKNYERGIYCDYFIALCIFLCLNGCITSQVRYTRPSRSTLQNQEAQPPAGDTIKEQQAMAATDTFEGRLKRLVESYIGVPYSEGGTTRRGMDCSGFVWRVYNDLGKKDFKRTSSSRMYRLGHRVSLMRAKPGDLIFFRGVFRINHVGIYMGNNIFVHASAKAGITYTSLDDEYFSQHFSGIRRMF